MNCLLTSDLWKEAAKLSKSAKTRHAAITYVTSELVQFGKGDVLIADASERAIRMGETSAKVLANAHSRGTQVYSCPNLHAKVLVLDDDAIIGSANLSQNSGTLQECAVRTNDPVLVGEARAFVQQLREGCERLTTARLAALSKIKVLRQGGRGGSRSKQVLTLGKRRWIVGLTPIKDRNMSANDQETVKRTMTRLERKLAQEREGLSWLRMRGTSSMRAEGRAGDRILMVNGSHSKTNHLTVDPPCTILARADGEDSTFFFYEERESERRHSLGKTDFVALLRDSGSSLVPTPRMVRELSLELFERLEKGWLKQ